MAALFLLCCVTSACTNSEKAAAQLGAQAQSQLESGDIAGARLSIDKAIKARDDMVELHLLKGQIEMAGHSLEAAFLSYYNAMSLDPVNQTALQAVAMLGLQTGHPDAAETAAGKLLSLSPQQPTALLVKGLIALERKRFPEAMAAADAILANAPTDEGAVVLKARTLFLADKRDDAKALIQRTITLSGNTAGLSRLMLEIQRAEGNGPGMLEEFARLRQFGQSEAQQVFDEANVRYKTGDRVGAARLIDAGLLDEKVAAERRERLIELWREYDPSAPVSGKLPRPKNEQVREALARYLIERGRAAEAEQMLVGIGSSNAQGLRSRILVAKGQTGPARDLANAVVAEDTGQCDARIVLATLKLAAHDTAAAVSDGQQASSECPTLADGWLITAQAYAAGGEPRQVERVFRDGLISAPDDLRLHAAFVDWLKRAGRAGEAIGVARHMVRYAPNRISSWQLVANTCTTDDCKAEAAQGLAFARTSLVIDRRPGEVPQRGLFAALRSNNDCQRGGQSDKSCPPQP